MRILDNAFLYRAIKIEAYDLLKQTIVDTDTMCLERTRI